jgi:hypothetical protein
MLLRDVDSLLSKSRLRLLDKQKEVRECVHLHYKDLLGVADHATIINEKSDVILTAYDRLSTLTRSLRVKASTAQLAAKSDEREQDLPLRKVDVVASEYTRDSCLSLRARILFHAQTMEFREILTILENDLPRILKAQTSEIDPFSDVLAEETKRLSNVSELVTSCCWRAISSPALESLESFVSCVELLRRCAPAFALSEFWQRRALLVAKAVDVLDQMKGFDLTIAGSKACGLMIDEDFLNQLGGHFGLIASKLSGVLGEAISSIHAIFEIYMRFKEGLDDFRKSSGVAPSEGTEDIAETVAAVVRETSKKAVVKALSGIRMESLKLESLEQSVLNLASELNKLGVYSRSESDELIAEALRTSVCGAVNDADLETRVTGINACELYNSFKDGGRLGAFSSAQLDTSLHRLSVESFDWMFDGVCANLCAKHRLSEFNDIAASDLKYVHCFGTTDDQVDVPCRLSPFTFSIVFGVTRELVTLPDVCLTGPGIESAKSAILRIFVSRFSETSADSNIQLLFDAVCVGLLCSSSNPDESSRYFSETFFPALEGRVLHDSVENLLYKHVLNTTAFDMINRNLCIFQPFIQRNPLWLHYESTRGSMEPQVSTGNILASLAGFGRRFTDRFPSLPVAKAPVMHQSAPPSATHAVSSEKTLPLQSFFNQVGRIKLGTK